MSDREPTAPTSAISPGLVAAAATTGALIAMGHRQGDVMLPFAAIAATILRRTVTTSDGSFVAIGVVLHVLLTLFWSTVFVRLARRGWRSSVAAIVVALLAHAASWLTARATGNGLASVLPLGDRILLGATLACALDVGIRLAFSQNEDVTLR